MPPANMPNKSGFEPQATPMPQEALDQELQAHIRDAVERTPVELQERIGAKTIGNPQLWQHVILDCEGDDELAALLLSEDAFERHLGEAGYDKAMVGRELESIRSRMDQRRTELEQRGSSPS